MGGGLASLFQFYFLRKTFRQNKMSFNFRCRTRFYRKAKELGSIQPGAFIDWTPEERITMAEAERRLSGAFGQKARKPLQWQEEGTNGQVIDENAFCTVPADGSAATLARRESINASFGEPSTSQSQICTRTDRRIRNEPCPLPVHCYKQQQKEHFQQVELRGPNGERVQHSTNWRPDGTVEIAFRPQELGHYDLLIGYKNAPAHGNTSSLDVPMVNINSIPIKEEIPAELPQEIKQEIFDERPSEIQEMVLLQERQQASTSTTGHVQQHPLSSKRAACRKKK